MTVLVAFQRIHPAAKMPTYATPGAAGADLYAALDYPDLLGVGERRLIPCGFKIALPEGYEAQVRPRSGLALKHGVTVLNSPGTIDADYRGEVGVVLINHGEEPFAILSGDRIAQMVVTPVLQQAQFVNTFITADTARGEGGFGSTGNA